jgi:hydrogenase-1 operon protein HyaE
MSPLLRQLIERRGLPLVDDVTLDAFLDSVAADGEHALLFFSGDGAQRPETADVAVVLPELLKAFAGRARGAVIAPQAEEPLRARFHAYVSPSLVVARGREPVGVLPKICDWTDYVARIEVWLDPNTPVLSGAKRPQVEFTFSDARSVSGGATQ